MNSTNPSAPSDDFRIVDLFSPGEASASPAAPQAATPPTPPRAGGRAPESFVFTNPLFGSAPDAKRST